MSYSPDGRQPLAVYAVSYVVTYVIGALWVGFTDGEALVSYFRDRLYVPTVESIGPAFWIVLLAPLVIPVVILPLLFRAQRSRSTPQAGLLSMTRALPEPGLVPFAILFACLCGYMVKSAFGSGGAMLDVLASIGSLNGDMSTIIERRLALFGSATTATFGILYSALPALCHVALFKSRTGGWPWRIAAALAIIATLTLSFATYQVGLATVLIMSMFLSAWHLKLLRITSMKFALYALGLLLLTQGLNAWKFAEWTFVENIEHLVLRMPSAYVYYLDCFPGTVPFLGTDWLGSLTGHGIDPASPFVVAQFMYPRALTGAAMAAPAHVQAYAEGGVLNALFAAGAIGLILAAVGRLYRESRHGAIMHAAYLQALVAVYYLTQTSFRGAVWHSYGYMWTFGALCLLSLLSWRPRAVFVPAARVARAG